MSGTSLVASRIGRSLGYLLLTDRYLDSVPREQVAQKALGEREAARERADRARLAAAERDVADSVRSLRERGSAHLGKLAERREARLLAQVVAATVKPGLERRQRDDDHAPGNSGIQEATNLAAPVSRIMAVLMLGLAGCSGVSKALPPPSRLLCYAEADRHAQESVNALCPPDAGLFELCPAHDAIMSQLQADQEACK